MCGIYDNLIGEEGLVLNIYLKRRGEGDYGFWV